MSVVTATTRDFCDSLNNRLAASGKVEAWFQAKPGPNYVKVLLHRAPLGVPSPEAAAFCFVVKEDEPFGWDNYRAGDVLPPKSFRKPWKMDTGAVANVYAPDGGVSYWVVRYGSDLGLW